MAETTRFELVSPERLFFSQPVEMIVIPGTEGDFAVMPDRMPFMSTIRPGVIVIFENGKPKEQIFVAGGFVEATEETCTVLAEHAILVSDLSLQDAEARFQKATQAYADAPLAAGVEKQQLDTELTIATVMYAAAKGEFAYH